MAMRGVLSLVAVGCLLVGLTTLAGCKGHEFSQEEVKQMEQGPPHQMPPQAVKTMQRMNQGGPSRTPPRPAGQPGPGAPGGVPNGPKGR